MKSAILPMSLMSFERGQGVLAVGSWIFAISSLVFSLMRKWVQIANIRREILTVWYIFLVIVEAIFLLCTHVEIRERKLMGTTVTLEIFIGYSRGIWVQELFLCQRIRTRDWWEETVKIVDIISVSKIINRLAAEGYWNVLSCGVRGIFWKWGN